MTQLVKNKIPNRSHLSASGVIADIWTSLALPNSAVHSVQLPGSGPGLPSSFKVGTLAQSTIALSALSAALVHSARNSLANAPKVTVSLSHACAEFSSERYLTINGQGPKFESYPIGGLHRTSDGWVRIHDGFPHHRRLALGLLGLPETASRQQVDAIVQTWKALDLEEQGMARGCVISALRSFEQWDATDQAQSVSDSPVHIREIAPAATAATGRPSKKLSQDNTKALQGVRVLDLSRVLAAPIAGRTLAAHGADVLWITAPHLPDLPDCDRDTARGKRTIQFDLRKAKDKQAFIDLVKDADVVLQSYRPGALAEGPWKERRGFDSIVQTASGLNVAEAEAFADGSESKVLPCQALDHGSGYLLATGICAGLYNRETKGGAWEVNVSLAGTGRYLRSLGRYDGKTGFECNTMSEEELNNLLQTKMSGLGELSGLQHSASIEGLLWVGI